MSRANTAADSDRTPLERVHELVDEYRVLCLWYVREDWYPHTDDEVHLALDAVSGHGNLDGFKRAEGLRKCFAPRSSRPSAVS